MREIQLALVLCILSAQAWADVNLDALINKVTLPLEAQEWVTTKSALINVTVNAALTDQGIERIQNDVLQQLNRLADKTEWHIVTFDRQQDKSGLENIQIIAQARLQQADLSNLREKAKAISKPGITFTVSNVQFTPTEEEIRQANTLLRANIYQQAKVEMDTLNKIYPDQKYYLYQINFFSAPELPAPMMQTAAYMKRADAAPAMASQPALQVGNKLILQANVILASFPDQLAQKVIHN